MADTGCFRGSDGGADACIRGIRRDNIYRDVVSMLQDIQRYFDIPRSGGDQALQMKTSTRCPVGRGARCCLAGATREGRQVE